MTEGGLRILVTGGAGYIGSHVVDRLRRRGYHPVVLDNLFSGHRWAVADCPLVVADLGDRAAVDRVLAEGRFEAIIHCAAHIWVGESVRDPGRYFLNNTCNAIALFDSCARHGVRHVVFSSTAAVYGEPGTPLIDEDTPLAPINPYGRSKMMAELALRDIAAAHGIGHVILRYFNVAGANDTATLGEATPDNSHLIKVACETAIGLRPSMRINGIDYPTPDGTCIRDYVHVDDLADAHGMALDHLVSGGPSLALNCGYGHGFSVREVLDTVQRISGMALNLEQGPRRPGDPPVLVADARRIRAALGWAPRHDDLDYIVATAWRWEQRLRAMRDAVPGQSAA
jgi:UDP-glucose 4-epimerase